MRGREFMQSERAPPNAGPLPQDWCNGSWWQFDVQGNTGGFRHAPEPSMRLLPGGC